MAATALVSFLFFSFVFTQQLVAPSLAATCLGFDNNPTTFMTSATPFQTAKTAGYTLYAGQFFNGAAVTSATTYSGLCAGVNKYGIDSLYYATQAGMLPRDAVHVPRYAAKTTLRYGCYPTAISSIKAQAQLPIDNMNACCGGFCSCGLGNCCNGNTAAPTIGRVWVVVSQSAGSQWSSTPANNVAWMTEFLSYFPTVLGPQVGILTNQTDFQAIFGSSYAPVDGNNAQVALWFQAPDGQQNYNNFASFNGWTTPTEKQYALSQTNIGGSGLNGNLDYMPC